jgi:hypothetical protein
VVSTTIFSVVEIIVTEECAGRSDGSGIGNDVSAFGGRDLTALGIRRLQKPNRCHRRLHLSVKQHEQSDWFGRSMHTPCVAPPIGESLEKGARGERLLCII